jgi:KUP system potassium uptake protein
MIYIITPTLNLCVQLNNALEFLSMAHSHQHPSSSHTLLIGALGIVYGDIGTSPLYAFKQSIDASGGSSADNVISILSLMIWALIFVVTIKYVLVIMRANNKGEGGTLALTALAMDCVKSPLARWFVLAAGLIGASLFYGDSVITPAISVLSAIEGIEVATPLLKPYIIPITIVLITLLFAIERHGTATIGRLFGPIMVIWFVMIGALGLNAMLSNLSVLQAINPLYGINFLVNHIGISSAVLGAVVLTVTGGEALYADMGHFGMEPIRKSWLYIVFPSLLLNYLGQGALIISDPSALDNPFYRLAPAWMLFPMVVLAALATIIASQAVISGAFSITNQAVQLGYIPRIRVRHTSSDEMGQIYVSKVNIFLFIAVIALVLGFKTSDSLASAYGIAVTGTMATVTSLALIVMIRKLHWPELLTVPLFSAFLIVDVGFFTANLDKFYDGGWLPITVATLVFIVMLAWRHGREKLLKARWKDSINITSFLASIRPDHPIRVPGTGIFMVPNTQVVPLSLLHNLKHNHILHERVILMTVKTRSIPYVSDDERIEIEHLDHNFHIVTLHYGFFEEPKILRALAQLRIKEFHFKLADVSFFVGSENVISMAENPVEAISDRIFISLHRNMMTATEYFNIPPGHVVELGGQVKI